MKVSSRRSVAWVTRWAWPRRGWPRASVRSSRSSASWRRRASAASAARRSSSAAWTAATASLTARPASAPLLRGQRAEAGLAAGQRAALAEHLGLDGPQLVEGRGAGDRVQSGGAGAVELVVHRGSSRAVSRGGVHTGPSSEPSAGTIPRAGWEVLRRVRRTGADPRARPGGGEIAWSRRNHAGDATRRSRRPDPVSGAAASHGATGPRRPPAASDPRLLRAARRARRRDRLRAQRTIRSAAIGRLHPSLAGGLEADDRGGHRRVEALGPSGVGDGQPAVDRRVGGQPVRLVADGERQPAGQVGVGVGRAGGRGGAERPGGRPPAAPPARRGRRPAAGTARRPTPARPSGWSASTVSGVSTTASAPAASAVRRMVPRLPGSDRPTATTTKPAPARTSGPPER